MSGQQQQADLVGGKGTLAEGGSWDGRSGRMGLGSGRRYLAQPAQST